MGRQKRDGNHSLPKKNSIQDREENEENRYPVPDSNKAHENTLKEETLQVITEKFMELLLDVVNQNVQEALKKFPDTKNKEYKTQKQINEFIRALSKHQSETESTINTEKNELKMKIDNIKEEVTHDMDNLRKKNETEIQSTMECHSTD
jgi:hypothetical protein